MMGAVLLLGWICFVIRVYCSCWFWVKWVSVGDLVKTVLFLKCIALNGSNLAIHNQNNEDSTQIYPNPLDASNSIFESKECISNPLDDIEVLKICFTVNLHILLDWFQEVGLRS
ncbi:unnamed protein product [Brassica napus]|uniref:(rape) hypothetical protein n=1 Tax=Brassica napus TaxID=3708 RepID=A0A816VFI8_BRANA|nr:unnamed protein product [Brassica napus]